MNTKKQAKKSTKNNLALLLLILLILQLTGCTKVEAKKSQGAATEDTTKEVAVNQVGQIYLYGEAHGVAAIIEKEFELWKGYYDKQNMRHLFVEKSFYSAEFLNLWMKADNDEILDSLFNDLIGTQGASDVSKKFYQRIKKECPETIFHGTDVGHQYDITGVRYLSYLEDQNLIDSEAYKITQECIEQGKTFYSKVDDVYRENAMTENFKREFNKLDNENIMGIYGAAHTGLDQLDNSQSVPCMANQLNQVYNDNLYSEDLTSLALPKDPQRVDTIELAGKTYQASYFGKQNLTGFKDYASREFWRLEDAYTDFKDIARTDVYLPYDEYPMQIEVGQVFVIDYKKVDGTVQRHFYCSDGEVYEDQPITSGFKVK